MDYIETINLMNVKKERKKDMNQIPNNVERLLKRTESVLLKNWTEEIRISETRHYEPIYFSFLDFKKKIDNGSSIYLLKLEENNWKSKIEFIQAIIKYWSELSGWDIMTIKNNVYKSAEIENKILGLEVNIETRNEAQHLLDFIKHGKYCCWGQMDESAGSKIFRLVTSFAEFSQILNSDEVLEVTPKSKKNSIIQYKKIRVAMRYERVDERIYKAKGLYDEYKEFCKEFGEKWDGKPRTCCTDIHAFDLWNDLKDTATFYIYI